MHKVNETETNKVTVTYTTWDTHPENILAKIVKHRTIGQDASIQAVTITHVHKVQYLANPPRWMSDEARRNSEVDIDSAPTEVYLRSQGK